MVNDYIGQDKPCHFFYHPKAPYGAPARAYYRGQLQALAKELEPLAQELEAKADQLEQGLASEQLGGAGNLAGLMQEVLAQARVESIKFRRGDYL